MSDVIQLKSAFVGAAYGKINPSIIRCTADIVGNVVTLQFVIRTNHSEDDIDDVRDIIGDVVGNYNELIGSEEIFECSGIEELNEISPRAIILFRVPDRYV